MAASQPQSSRHEPVLLRQVVALLVTDTQGAYLDLTAGGGGHLKALAECLGSRGRLYGVDRDPAAVLRAQAAVATSSRKTQIIRAAFGDIADAVAELDEQTFDGILLDLGLSSDQLDDPERGFSFRFDAPLDMRFDPGQTRTAADLLHELPHDELARLFREYGEERQAARIATAIVRERQKRMISTTAQLRDIVLSVIRPPHENKSLARCFQALRIAINDELSQLRTVLPSSRDLLKAGGRLAVISYHSLEDRLVKRWMNAQAKGECICPPEMPVCGCGAKSTMKLVTRKPVLPDEDEIETNPRARSAKLRVAEKLV